MSCSPSEENVASPKVKRAISERRPFAPVTPQRINRLHKQARTPSSPMTPANSSIISSPFTPITNVYSSASSIASPNSSVSTKVEFSPEIMKSKTKSIADTTNNWRTRAKENGIKVTAENSNKDLLNSPNDILPASFLSTHRRSRQALFQTKSSDGTAFITPKTARMPFGEGVATAPIFTGSNISASVLNTPEPNRTMSEVVQLSTPSPQTSLAIIQKLRQRGCLTDPARPRRREPFGSQPREILFDIDENTAALSPYPQTFTSPLNLNVNSGLFSNMRSVSAPFNPGRFPTDFEDDDEYEGIEDDGLPSAPKCSKLRATKSVSSLPATAHETGSLDHDDATNDAVTKGCSVCSSGSTLATLKPCGHLICSACITGSLNIVGEKDMRCTVCEKPVSDFKLLDPLKIETSTSEESKVKRADEPKENEKEGELQLLPSAFEELSIKDNVKPTDARESSSAPNTAAVNLDRASNALASALVAVLRIDNVPWDITPPALREFFAPHDLTRAHVLLDPKGKTLSHAYVELPASDARNALRAVQNKTMGKGRRLRGVTVTMSNQSELMRALFPSWLGGFEGAKPTLNGLDRAGVIRTLENGLVTFSELDGLTALMRNPKSHFLKVPSLPFHSLVSILSKFPVDMDSRVFWSASLRDGLFDVAIAGLQLLVNRVDTELHDQQLLEDAVKAAVGCQVFTNEQRTRLYKLIETSITVKGGELGSIPPLSLLCGNSAPSDEVSTPDDSVSSVSASSGGTRSLHYQIGMGRPSVSHNQRGSTVFANASVFSPSAQPNYAVMASPPLMASPMMGYANNRGLALQYAMMNQVQTPFDMLAHEFGVEPDLVAALAQRLAATSPISPPAVPAALFPNHMI